MKKLWLILLLFFLSACNDSKNPTPDIAPIDPSVQYAVFTDFRSDPDDKQSLIRLFYYPEITPSFILVQNGDGGQRRVEDIINVYAQDYPKLAPFGAKSPEYWRSIVHHTHVDTKATDFKDIKDAPLWDGQEAFIAQMDSNQDIYDIWVWGTATELAHILYKRADLASRIRIISVGGWNKDQDQSAHDFLWGIKGSLKAWINTNSGFRGMYCNYSGNRQFVESKIKPNGALGRKYWELSRTINTGAYTIKEGDTPTFFFSLKCDFNDPLSETCWAGKFNRVEGYPHVWSDRRDSSDQCGFIGSGPVIKQRPDFQNSFHYRLTRKK